MAGNKARRQRRAQRTARARRRGEGQAGGAESAPPARPPAGRVARAVAAEIVAHDDRAAAEALLRNKNPAGKRPASADQTQQRSSAAKKRPRSDSTDPETRRPAKVTLTGFAAPTLQLQQNAPARNDDAGPAQERLAHVGKLSRDLLQSLEEAHVAREAKLADERAKRASSRVLNTRRKTGGNVFAALAEDDDDDEEGEDAGAGNARRSKVSTLFFAPSTLILDSDRKIDLVFGDKTTRTSTGKSHAQQAPQRIDPASVALPDDSDDDL